VRSRLTAVAILGIAVIVIAAAAVALGDQTPRNETIRDLKDIRPDLYSGGDSILGAVAHALPAFAVGALTFILVMRFLGFLEMGAFSVLVLVAIIGGIVWKFYWPLGH
jgi:hypothetical protein